MVIVPLKLSKYGVLQNNSNTPMYPIFYLPNGDSKSSAFRLRVLDLGFRSLGSRCLGFRI